MLSPFWVTVYVGPSGADVGPPWAYIGLARAYVGPSWAQVEPILGLCWPYFGSILSPSWAYVGLSGGYVGCILLHYCTTGKMFCKL